MQNIGIFAGSFDPIHDGHLACATAAQAACSLDRVYFVVEPRPRHKQGVKALEHRTAMTRLAISDIADFRQIMIDEPYCTMNETLPMLRNRFEGDKLFFIMGDDVARHIAQWPQLEVLAEQVELVIVQRSIEPAFIECILARLKQTQGVQLRYRFITEATLQRSSLEVRQQIKRGEQPSGLHPGVWDYIQQQKLYGSSGFGS